MTDSVEPGLSEPRPLPPPNLPWRLLQAMTRAVARVAPRQRGRLQKAMIGAGYNAISAFGRSHSTFMNFGYAIAGDDPRSLALRPEDVADTYCIQLYERVVAGIPLAGKDVLEVGSGRGGGAAFVTRYLMPQSMTGVDYAASAIRFCRRHHRLDGLTFVRGDAEQLPFPDASFDVVLNVESSHCYPSFERFIGEVARVLRPGGHFLFADIRLCGVVPELRASLGRPFSILDEERITRNVLRALDLDTDRRSELIARGAPGALRRALRNLSALRGTRTFVGLSEGRLEYLRFTLQKPAEPAAAPRR